MYLKRKIQERLDSNVYLPEYHYSLGDKLGSRKTDFQKCYITGDRDMFVRWMITFIVFLSRGITKKDIL